MRKKVKKIKKKPFNIYFYEDELENLKSYARRVRLSISDVIRIAVNEFLPCESENEFTNEEWGKLEKLVSKKGKTYRTSEGAINHLKRLMKD